MQAVAAHMLTQAGKELEEVSQEKLAKRRNQKPKH